MADGRYLLTVNGQRVQWGPAPSDPRWTEVDPADLTEMLRPGANTIGAQVLYYGHGDGTWPLGKCGFLFWLELETSAGEKHTIVSDASWRAFLARSWKPGHYKRWYLRCLQEEFDARLYPYAWTNPDFKLTEDWLAAMPLNCPSDEPAICSNYTEYMLDLQGEHGAAKLRARSVPAMREYVVPVLRLAESCSITWTRPVEGYFEFRAPDAFHADREPRGHSQMQTNWKAVLCRETACTETTAVHRAQPLGNRLSVSGIATPTNPWYPELYNVWKRQRRPLS